MSITFLPTTQLGQFSFVQVTSDLGGAPTFFWYLDGTFLSRTDVGEIMVYLPDGDQADIFVVDTLSPEAFDISANAPTVFPSRRTLWWARSLEADVLQYTIEQEREAEGFVEIGEVAATDAWSYRFITPRLDDLTTYQWRIIPVDVAGNQGTALALGPELIVRRPDSPDFTIVFTPGTLRVEFFAAA